MWIDIDDFRVDLERFRVVGGTDYKMGVITCL